MYLFKLNKNKYKCVCLNFMKFSQTFLFDWIWLHNFSDFFGIGKTWCCSIKPSKWYENNLIYWNNQITGNLWHSICKDDATWPGLVSQNNFSIMKIIFLLCGNLDNMHLQWLICNDMQYKQTLTSMTIATCPDLENEKIKLPFYFICVS